MNKADAKYRKLVKKWVKKGNLDCITLTIKARLYPHNKKATQAFKILRKNFANACSFCSKRYFDSYYSLGSTKLHRRYYKMMKRKFGLTAQFAESVPRNVIARYKAVNTQMYIKSRYYKDINTGKHFRINKNLDYLWSAIKFHTPQADLIYNNNWSFTHKNGKKVLSIGTLNGRKKVQYYIPPYFRKLLHRVHLFGDAKLLYKHHQWYLYISCSIFMKHIKQHIKDIVGSDRGQRYIIFTYDKEHHSYEITGLNLRRKRSEFLKQRRTLQSKNTPSAKRKLKNESGTEHGWMVTEDHKISKALVQKYPKDTLFILENLRGVKFEAMNASRSNRYSRESWTFYQLGQDLMYKAKLRRSAVRHINPAYTSQRCPRCGYVIKASRNHHKHIYICKHCGYKSNDDRIGGMNIQFLGILQQKGYKRPFIKKNNQIGYHIKVHKRTKNGKKLKKIVHKIKYLSRKKALELVPIIK